ncbi:MAG TPA: carboxypeptidase-like regulatory domain-containing protein [Bryobacteraceae bacterium]|jgi:hypothetical protein
MLAGALHAAVIRGVVVENQTGHPLARARIDAVPISGTEGPSLTVRTNVAGAFEIARVPPGTYLVTASRRGYAPVQYGQRRWGASGIPLVLEETSTAALNIRLPRFGAITGTVGDENEVGLPFHELLLYRNTRPLELLDHVEADDRGVYRFYGLAPGSYLVRTVGRDYFEGSYLPTFAPRGATIDEAIPAEVSIDRDTTDVNLRPTPGTLVSLSGYVGGLPNGKMAAVTLISDMGRQTVTTSSAFLFRPLPPGPYEIRAEFAGDERSPALGAYTTLVLDRDRTDFRVRLVPWPKVDFAIVNTEGQPIAPPGLRVLARRKDLAERGAASTLPVINGQASLGPGRWELALDPMTDYFVAGFSGPAGPSARPDGWNEITVEGGPMAVRFVLAPDPGSVHGTVKIGDGPIAGAPVFLEAWDPESRRRVGDLRATRTDSTGGYRFTGLAPGAYRILSTFEFREPDSAAMAAGRVIKVERGKDQLVDLGLYVMP